MFPDTGNTDKQAVMIGSVTAAGGVAVLAIIGLVVLFIKYRIARLIMNRNKVGDLYTTQDEQMRRQNVEKDETLWLGRVLQERCLFLRTNHLFA